MKRRTILKRVGAASAIAAGFSGTAAAKRAGTNEGTKLDLSDRSGEVAVSDLDVDPEAVVPASVRQQLPAGVDPSDVRLQVDESAGVVQAMDIKCNIGCCTSGCPSECDVCTCYSCPVLA